MSYIDKWIEVYRNLQTPNPDPLEKAQAAVNVARHIRGCRQKWGWAIMATSILIGAGCIEYHVGDEDWKAINSTDYGRTPNVDALDAIIERERNRR